MLRTAWLLGAVICGMPAVQAGPTALPSASGLSVELVPIKNGVEFVVRNDGDTAVLMLPWDSPLDRELTHDSFSVVPKGGFGHAEYQGRWIKRPLPAAHDYISIEAGSSARADIELGKYYRLDPNVYTVQYRDSVQIAKPSGETEIVYLQSNSVNVGLVPALVTERASIQDTARCTADQESLLAGDINAAEEIAVASRNALAQLPQNSRSQSPRYTKWFGQYSASRYDAVLGTFTKTATAIESGNININCGCNESYYAYVYPNNPYNIYVCSAFWQASRTGVNSRAGTIVHELSHFTVVGRTDDHAYGTSAATSLALTDPDRATDNADNFEYFAENTPFVELAGADEAPVSYTELTLGGSVQGTLAAQERNYYRVDNASEVRVTTSSGDADLYVYSSPARDREICQSTLAGGNDTCNGLDVSSIYIEVLGYSDSTYTITAIAAEEAPEVVVLEFGAALTRSVFTNDIQVFQVDNGQSVIVNSLSGDVDLSVYTSDVFTPGTLFCESTNASFQSRVDQCELTGGTDYVVVVANTNSQFTIASEAQPSTPVSNTLVVGQSANDSVSQNEQHFYVVNGANAIELNTLSGDADLFVYSSESRSSESVVCISQTESSINSMDRCDLNGGTSYISVLGFDTSNYEITAIAGATVVPDPEVTQPEPEVTQPEPEVTQPEPADEPITVVFPETITTTPGGGGSSGGGSFGSLLIALMLVVANRRRMVVSS